MPDRIVELTVTGLRSLANVRLSLTNGLVVLIGENGSGKSSLLEALQILRLCAEPGFFVALNQLHGGLPNLLRAGENKLRIGARIEGGGTSIDYAFTIGSERDRVAVEEETLDIDLGPSAGAPMPRRVLARSRVNSEIFDADSGRMMPVNKLPQDSLHVSQFGAMDPPPPIARTVDALRAIDVRLPFEVRALWSRRRAGVFAQNVREPTLLEPAPQLAPGAQNLASCFHHLRNGFTAAHWSETMDLVRLGLGDDVVEVKTQVVPGGGHIALTMEIRTIPEQVYASAMSDGQLAYLAWVALHRLGSPCSILACDEPETHLHPALLARVLGMFETSAQSHPVVLATQSDRLLDALADPARSVVLCERNQRGATELRRPNREVLDSWLERYRGLGDLRGEGYEGAVMTEPS